ncbi:MAG: ScaI family restriction endonuclease [Candidatus Electrothrix sp. AUS1_2]|nr:ScaI family restriction endonuclease [Candidatus Electrothrix sp. AUS1_2]
MADSPYVGTNKAKWPDVTQELLDRHPLEEKEIEKFVLAAWDDIFESSIGRHRLKIGKHIFPKPQIIGALLHELIPAEISAAYPDVWRAEESADDKDIVHRQNDKYSIELKTSSHPRHIFGNRSYAQKPIEGKKTKDGYYLAVNFEKLSRENTRPDILLIRFGWLDHSDWIGQRAATGQQARLAPETYNLKFKTLFSKR